MNILSVNKFSLNFSCILFCLIPIALISGPFLPDLFVTLISLIYLIFFFKRDKYDYFLKIYLYISLIFYTFITISALASDVVLISLKSSIFYFRFIFFVPAVIFIFKNYNNLNKYFLNILLITSIVLIVDSLFQYFFGKNLFGYKPINIADIDMRITGMFGDDEILGSYLSKFIPILISLIFISNLRNKELITIIFLVFFGLCIFISSERASFVHYLIFSLSFILLSNLDFKKKFLLFLIIPIVLIVTLMDSGKKHRMLGSTFNSIKTLQFSKYHSDHYKTAYKMFKDKKIIGHGPKSFRFKCSNIKYKVSESSCSTHPHNTYLQLLSETGIFGFIIVFSIFIYLSFLILKIFYSKYILKNNLFLNSQVSIICGLFVYLFPISPNGNFFNNWLNIIFFLQILVFFLTNFKNSEK